MSSDKETLKALDTPKQMEKKLNKFEEEDGIEDEVEYQI